MGGAIQSERVDLPVANLADPLVDTWFVSLHHPALAGQRNFSLLCGLANRRARSLNIQSTAPRVPGDGKLRQSAETMTAGWKQPAVLLPGQETTRVTGFSSGHPSLAKIW
jgi:hypothetical protein